MTVFPPRRETLFISRNADFMYHTWTTRRCLYYRLVKGGDLHAFEKRANTKKKRKSGTCHCRPKKGVRSEEMLIAAGRVTKTMHLDDCIGLFFFLFFFSSFLVVSPFSVVPGLALGTRLCSFKKKWHAVQLAGPLLALAAHPCGGFTYTRGTFAFFFRSCTFFVFFSVHLASFFFFFFVSVCCSSFLFRVFFLVLIFFFPVRESKVGEVEGRHRQTPGEGHKSCFFFLSLFCTKTIKGEARFFFFFGFFFFFSFLLLYLLSMQWFFFFPVAFARIVINASFCVE